MELSFSSLRGAQGGVAHLLDSGEVAAVLYFS
jgi:hypothetical protein